MATQRKPKLYLAGPDVFRPDPLAHAEQQRALCAQYGFTPLHPVDNGPTCGEQSTEALLHPTSQLQILAGGNERRRQPSGDFLGVARSRQYCQRALAEDFSDDLCWPAKGGNLQSLGKTENWTTRGKLGRDPL